MHTSHNPTTNRPRRFRPGLAGNMMAILLPVTLIPTLLMGLVVYNRARTLLLQQVSERMDVFLSEAVNQLDSWLLDKSLALESLPRNPDFIESLENYLGVSPEDPQYQNIRNQTLAFPRAVNPPGLDPLFNHFMVLDETGEIVLSTNRAWEGFDLSPQAFFDNKIASGEYVDFLLVNPVFYNRESYPEFEISVISAIPIANNQGSPIGYLVGISNGRALQTVIEANKSFLPDNKVFIYNDTQQFAGIIDLNKSYSFEVFEPSQGQQELINTFRIDPEMARDYNSYDGTPVVGIYNFNASLNTGLVVEIPEENVLGTINALAPFAILVMVLAAVLISLLIYWGSRRISDPLKEMAYAAQSFSEGDWDARTEINRSDEIGSLAFTFNLMANDLSKLYQRMESQVEERTRQMVTASEVSTLATSSVNLDNLLDQTASLIAERFNFFHVSVYLLDSSKEIGQLRAATTTEGRNLIQQGHRIKIPLNSIFHWVIQNNQPKVVTLMEDENENLSFEMHPDAQSKVVVPISIGVDVFGFIDIQSNQADIFPQASTQVLQTLANQVASAIQNFRLREGTQVDLQQVSQLYQASQRITQATTENEIFNAIVTAVQQTTYFAAVYRPMGGVLKLVQPGGNKPYYADQLPDILPVSPEVASLYFEDEPSLILRNLVKPAVSIRPELLEPALAINAQEAAYLPIVVNDQLKGLVILASRDSGKISMNALQPFLALTSLVRTTIEKIQALRNTQKTLDNLRILTAFSNQIINETNPERLYALIHEQIKEVMGDVDFYVALYDSQTNHIEIPYLFEGDTPLQIDPFPLGEGLTSIVVRTRQPLMLVENTEERAKALGARIVGEPAKSWMGVPLIVSDEVIGIISLQDVEQENRFSEDDLNLLLTLSAPIAGAIQSSRLLAETRERAYQLETSAEISRETSTTLDMEELLSHSIQLIQDRFNFYHASIFLLDPAEEFAVVAESTGEAGQKMKADGHKLAVGSKSIIGYVTANREPLVVNDVTQDPTHKFNPLLSDTRAELGIPILLGDRVIGALDVQSTTPYAFSPGDIEVLQILANQLAVAITNANLFTETQEHLAQHRLIHHVTTVSASSTSIDDAISSAVQGLRAILGDSISILLVDKKTKMLQVKAAAGYENDVVGMQIEVGQGVTGWVAQQSEPLIVSNVLNDSRYIPGKDSVRSEIAVPLVYRGELLGVLNVESEIPNAYDEHDQDILGTLAGSLAAIIVNARLSERQQNLFKITNKIRQSVNMDTILETTAEELSKIMQARRTRIEVGGDRVAFLEPKEGGNNTPETSNGQEDER